MSEHVRLKGEVEAMRNERAETEKRLLKLQNSHEALIKLLSISLDYDQFSTHGQEVFKQRVRQALIQAEGK